MKKGKRRLSAPLIAAGATAVALASVAIPNAYVIGSTHSRMFPRDLSAAVREYLGRSHDGAHGAEADAHATLEVLKAELKRHAEVPRTVDEIDQWIAPTDPLNADRDGLFRWKNGEWTVNFGKKKGESLKRIMLDEPNFLKWMVKGDFSADARMVAADALKGRLPPPPAEAQK